MEHREKAVVESNGDKGKLNLSEDEIIQLMVIREALGKLFGKSKPKKEISPPETQQEEILKALRRIEYILQKKQGVTPSAETKIITEESKFKDLEVEAGKLDKAVFAESIAEIEAGIRLLKRRELRGPPAAALMYSLMFSLQMAIVYVKALNFGPDFVERFEKQLHELRNL